MHALPCCDDLFKGYICVCLCDTNGGGRILILLEWTMVVEWRDVLFENVFTSVITQICTVLPL
jgi:hypothetical protein